MSSTNAELVNQEGVGFGSVLPRRGFIRAAILTASAFLASCQQAISNATSSSFPTRVATLSPTTTPSQTPTLFSTLTSSPEPTATATATIVPTTEAMAIGLAGQDFLKNDIRFLSRSDYHELPPVERDAIAEQVLAELRNFSVDPAARHDVHEYRVGLHEEIKLMQDFARNVQETQLRILRFNRVTLHFDLVDKAVSPEFVSGLIFNSTEYPFTPDDLKNTDFDNPFSYTYVALMLPGTTDTIGFNDDDLNVIDPEKLITLVRSAVGFELFRFEERRGSGDVPEVTEEVTSPPSTGGGEQSTPVPVIPTPVVPPTPIVPATPLVPPTPVIPSTPAGLNQ